MRFSKCFLVFLIMVSNSSSANPFSPIVVEPDIEAPAEIFLSDEMILDIESITASWTPVPSIRYYLLEAQRLVPIHRERRGIELKWGPWQVVTMTRNRTSVEVSLRELLAGAEILRLGVRACKHTDGPVADFRAGGVSFICSEYTISNDVQILSRPNPCDLPPHCDNITPGVGGDI